MSNLLKPSRHLIYLAYPYSHPNQEVRRARFQAANHAAGLLMKEGHFVFSPISHTHPIAEAGDLPTGWEFWEGFDRAYLQHCHRIIVLRIEGWEQSVGVQAEIAIATEMGLIIDYIDAFQENNEGVMMRN
jgi:hypothetical protein